MRSALAQTYHCRSGRKMGTLCRELIHEEKAGSIAYRSTFGTQRVGGFIANAFDLYLKNPANTNVVEWGKRLLALWEVQTKLTQA